MQNDATLLEQSVLVPDYVLEITALKTVLTDCMLQELILTDEKDADRIIQWTTAISRQRLLRMLSTQALSSEFALAVSVEMAVREFALSFYERVMYHLTFSPTGATGHLKKISETMMTSRGLYLSSELLPPQDRDFLSPGDPKNGSTLKDLLQSDPWIITLYAMIACNAHIDAIQNFNSLKKEASK